MARYRSVDFLPEIFQTDTNKKFLSATLDQLTQEPIYKKINGYVGRRVGPGVNSADNYVTEPTKTRSDYQLEPGVVFLKPDTNTVEDAITYPGMIDALDLLGANTTNQDRLFQSEYYTWDPFCDFDKFSNYSQYFWLPNGPDPVDVASSAVPIANDYTVTRSADAYTFSETPGTNPTLTLARNGTYTFSVNQPGYRFWIQAAPGISGTMPGTPNISSRDVLGVNNNGEDQGTVTFNVPSKDAQSFYYNLTDIGTVDLVTANVYFNQLNNVFVGDPTNPEPGTFLYDHPTGIDGITNLNGRTIVFTNKITDPEAGGWEITTQFDPLLNVGNIVSGTGSFDSTLFDQTTPILDQTTRYSIWQIQYVYGTDGRPFMQLSQVNSVPNLSKFTVRFGTQYASTGWYKDAQGYFQEIPLLTADLDTLYYQDSINPEIFGRIQLINEGAIPIIDIDQIIGAKNYTAPNGVVFTNGLKVQFRGTTSPAQFENLTYYVEGVGTGPGLEHRVGFVDGEAYYGAWHIYQGQRLTGSVHNTTTFQQIIYDTLGESLENIGAGLPVGAPLPTQGQSGAALGNGIRLVPVNEMVTPEPYTKSLTIPYDSTSYDSEPFDGALNAPLIPDYLTINRSSRDRNAWSRSNRWFHIDVINATAKYNNTVAVLDNNYRGKRPIIEFRADLRLWNFGTWGKIPVNIIDFTTTDALSTINNQLGYGIDGYTFVNGTRVIFAADQDPQVRNSVYEVQFIDPDNSGTKIIDLVPIYQGQALIDQTVVCLSGSTLQGISFWYDGSQWVRAQQKTNVNQPPLFNVYDGAGRSFGDHMVYPSTTFAGSKLFGYALGGTQTADQVLGFALKFANINNLGDIVFQNYLYTDSFIYVRDNNSITVETSTGFVRQYLDSTLFSRMIGWQPAAAENRSRQIFRFSYDGTSLILDVPVSANTVYPPLQIFVEGIFVDPTNYTYDIVGNTTVVTFSTTYTIPVGTIIEVQALSDVSSSVAFYQVPLNLENNPLNTNSSTWTLGTIRNHYDTICQNLKTLVGPANGANNTRDLGDILRYGTNIIQNSSPMTLGGVFLRRKQFEVAQAISYNGLEYQKYKDLLLDLASRGDFVNYTATEILDQVMLDISLTRSLDSPFYWSDMITSGANYTENTYTYTNISTPTFNLQQVYDFTSSNFQGLSVFLNGLLLTRDYQYTVATDAATLEITAPLSVGDVIAIREYSNTYGSYVPNTPTKLGLYPAYKPEIFVDETYVNPTTVIRGHDGSITRAFGDARDQILLEFETRIFNNLKIVTPVPMTQYDVIPGQFRSTEYSLTEINQILSTDFLTWVGTNKIDYVTQQYDANEPLTWNYSQSANKLTGNPLLGAWRGIYLYFYDTLTPNLTPWEMLGFSQEPIWWQNEYGPAPYTSGNMVLWDDLAQGIVRDPIGTYVLPQFARPNLAQVIPAGTEGELLDPMQSVVGNYDATSFRRSWAFGDDGPAESAWRTSSSWPFAVMRLLLLTKPAKFFSLFADRDLYVYDDELEQYLWNDRYRLDAKNLAPLYGDGVSKASYIDWIIDYNRQLGVNSTERLTTALDNLDVRLCWPLAGFSDKRLLQIRTERSSPNSNNAGLLLPDESYQILLYQDQPFNQVAYSSVMVQIQPDGYAVLGYSTTRPYFEILASVPNGQLTTISAGGTTVKVATAWTDNVVQVPYGYTFTNTTAVCDFLLSYGKFLETQGMEFADRENNLNLNWSQMAAEFLYFSQQGWAPGTLINLNPGATTITVGKDQSIIDDISRPGLDNIVLNQNRIQIPLNDLVVNRIQNQFNLVSTTNNNTINYVNLKYTAYEHLVILDNVSIFADLIYDPATGARQSRVLASGSVTGDWTGLVDTPGFILNQPDISEWVPNQKYSKGQIVTFKNQYWAASTIIQPSQEFDYTLWLKTPYGQIQTGLLPNAANDSDQLALAYSVYDANLELEVDLFSYGLIGFRPRKYMQALNLTDTSQVQLYQQFLPTKGTVQATELFSYANLGKEVAQYDIFEYWAIQKGNYGATANQNYFELRLNQSLLTSDPCTVQVIQNDQASEADQTVTINQVWKSSKPVTSTDLLPTITNYPADIGFPSAGYVNFEDVDYTLFSLDDIGSLTVDLPNLGVGSTIWVAKSNSHDWNVYRAEPVNGDVVEVTDNLNGRALVTFDAVPGLSVGDIVIIDYFNPAVNGVYRVLSVPSLYTITIGLIFTGNQTTFTGTGVAFTLQTCRVAQASNADILPYSRSLVPGAKIWVDDNGSGLWEVIEKNQPFEAIVSNTPSTVQIDQKYGVSVSQAYNNGSAMVGAPGYDSNGGVWTYVKDVSTNQYIENYVLTPGPANVSGFGNAVDYGYQNWAVVGASTSYLGAGAAFVINVPPANNVFTQWQALCLSADDALGLDEFGYSVNMSQDDRWLYIGAPGANRVYCYQKIDYQDQLVQYEADGVTYVYNYNNHIVIDDPSQMVVSVNNTILTLNTDYVLINNNVQFASIPLAGSVIRFVRRPTVIFNGNGSPTFNLSSLYMATTIEALAVYKNDQLQMPGHDYTFNSGTKNVTFNVTPALTDVIQIRATSYYTKMGYLLAPTLSPTDRFGHSVVTSTNGRTVIVGCPESSSAQGRVYVFDRSVQKFTVTNATQTIYTTTTAVTEPCTVYLNGQVLTSAVGNVNGEVYLSGNTVNILVPLAVGDIIEVDLNQFSLIQSIMAANPCDRAKFGSTIDLCLNDCSLYVGSPYDNTLAAQAGSVDFDINQSRVYGVTTSTVNNPVLTQGNYIRINNQFVRCTGTDVVTLAADINAAGVPNVTAIAANGYITISVIDAASMPPSNKLTVLPGTGTLFDDLAFDTFVAQQVITSPVIQPYSYFGHSVNISDTSNTLVVGAPNGTSIESTTFDGNATYFDSNSTVFADAQVQSGAVYTFDALEAANPSINNPRQFVFGQGVYDSILGPLDQFGAAVNYTTGILLIGSPGYSIQNTSNNGRSIEFLNLKRLPAWQAIRRQTPVVDIRLLNDVYMYDITTMGGREYFDYFDPLQGRLLGAVRQNIDYICAVDPAAYNVGPINNYGDRWAQERVGQIWWDINNARFIDPNQGDITYASRRWGQLFPGSSVDVYQWVASSVPPDQYTDGIPLNTQSYSVTVLVNNQGAFITTYFFWARDLTTVATTAKKTLSIRAIAQYIESPRSSGIAYIAPLNASTVAIYNGLQYLSAQDIALHVNYDQELNDNPIHLEYQFIGQDRPRDFLYSGAYKKLQDSFCGVDSTGGLVPDVMLPISQQYGIQFRPRQSMFVNRFLALKNYLMQANTVLAQYPITEMRRFNLLDSREPYPSASSGAWNQRVVNIEELGYQDLDVVPVGYRYLVESDSTQQGRWTIYEVVSANNLGAKTFLLNRVQNYDTMLYWFYIDWYQPGYNPSTRITATVPYYASLSALDVPDGSSVKVTNNAMGRWEIYQLVSGTWARVGLQNGTIEFDSVLWDYQEGRFGFDVEVFDAQYFDQEPVIETRKIIQAINEELFIDDLAIERNRLLILMFNYVLTEQGAPQWLVKTSLIDVDHKIRKLLPYQIYRADNQDFVLDYIQEVKPYHTHIRQFNLIYDDLDTYQGTITDFDLPAYWDTNENLFVSPILDDTGTMSTTSSVPSTSAVWQTLPWNQWYQNYLLDLVNINLISGGSGYTEVPTVTVVGDCIAPAILTSQINSAGRVVAINIVDPGYGYATTPTIVITGGNGSGAQATAVMGNQQVRSLRTTIKYDRYQYNTTIKDWQPDTTYTAGTQVRYADRVWSANTTVNTTIFELPSWTLVPANSLSGVDRTMGYYVPTVNEPGLDLGLLIPGTTYPGVQVYGPDFNWDTGFDVGNFDITPFDNLSYGPEGRPTYDPAILDAIYESEFTDPYLGTAPAPAYDGVPPNRPDALVVDGGAFVDTYESHAPEELTPGIIYDTLDMRVFTTPGSDYLGLGFGGPRASRSYVYDSANPVYSFDDLLPVPMVAKVWNVTQGFGIEFATFDWPNYLVTIPSAVPSVPGQNVNDGDQINIEVFATGGGNQLMSATYLGGDIGDRVEIPFSADIISGLVVFNGKFYIDPSHYTITSINQTTSLLTFDTTYTNADRISFTVLGYETPITHSWSLPMSDPWVSDGSLTHTLINYLGGTNPVNAVVVRNGYLCRPPAGARYIGDGSTTDFELPTQVGYSQGSIADNDVSVYLNNNPLTLGIDYEITPWDGSTVRAVSFFVAPPTGALLLISVRTGAQYWIQGDQIIFQPSQGLAPQPGDIMGVFTWNDTSQQDLLTQVFVGPTNKGVTVSQGYDSVNFDSALVNDTSGSFDYSTGAIVQTNEFDTGRLITNPQRLLVTLDGRFLFYGDQYIVDGTKVIIAGPIIGAGQAVTITSTTENVVPSPIAFRIFQDMRGLQLDYRITESTTTELAQDLSADDNIIYVLDAGRLTVPNLEKGIFGQITIDGERIAYRTVDINNNTVSSLRRGIAGTAAADHSSGSAVYDIGPGNLIPIQYQNYPVYENFIGNGSTTTFAAVDIDVSDLSPTEQQEAVRIYVGGILQTSGYTLVNTNPATVNFDTPPVNGYQITILVNRALIWYHPGVGTASDGVPLQDTDTAAARFIRGV